jgi:integrase
MVSGRRIERLYALGDFALPPSTESAEAADQRRAGRLFTLAEARLERDRVRGLVRQGLCPTQERKRLLVLQREESATTFALVAEEWIEIQLWEDITKARRRQMVQRVVNSHIGRLALRSITPRHVLDLLNLAVTNNGPTVAAEAKRTLSRIFEHAISTLRLEHNPVSPLRGALPANKTQHKRALSHHEIGELLTAIHGYDRNHQTVGAFTLMWLTLCRPSEAVGATWAELDLDNGLWRIPAKRMKMREPHISPLPQQAIHMLRRMKAINGDHPHVFPHRDNRNQPMTEGALRQALRQLNWSGRYSPHATRTTGSTILNELGYNRDWVERQLAHRDRDSARSAYNQASYLQDRRRMLQDWADLLDKLAMQIFENKSAKNEML